MIKMLESFFKLHLYLTRRVINNLIYKVDLKRTQRKVNNNNTGIKLEMQLYPPVFRNALIPSENLPCNKGSTKRAPSVSNKF